MAENEYRPMQVGQILDKSTVVITGPGVENLKIGDELQILAVGREIPTIGVPLVVPKAVVLVQSNAGPYVLARTGTYEAEVDPISSLGSIGSLYLGKTKEMRRYELRVDDKQIVGNPATSQVSVGDPVIKPSDLQRFIASLRAKPGSIADLARGKS
jgi:hypothetical protein